MTAWNPEAVGRQASRPQRGWTRYRRCSATPAKETAWRRQHKAGGERRSGVVPAAPCNLCPSFVTGRCLGIGKSSRSVRTGTTGAIPPGKPVDKCPQEGPGGEQEGPGGERCPRRRMCQPALMRIGASASSSGTRSRSVAAGGALRSCTKPRVPLERNSSSCFTGSVGSSTRSVSRTSFQGSPRR